MSEIDFSEGGGRTVYNHSVYDARRVFTVTCDCVLDEVRSEWNEVHKTGRTIREDRTYHIIAVNERLARCAFEEMFPMDRFKIIDIKPLPFIIDGEMDKPRTR